MSAAQLARSTPELKEYFIRVSTGVAINAISVTPIAIAQGLGSDQRVGDRVRIMDVCVLGIPSGIGSYVTASLVSTKNSSTPAIGDFTAGPGAWFDGQKGWTLATFTPQSIGGNITSSTTSFMKRFPKGMIQDYIPGTSTFNKGAIHYCVPNATGTAITGIDCVIRVRYYDV